MPQSKLIAEFSYVFTIFQLFGLIFFKIKRSYFSEMYQKFCWIHCLIISIGLLSALKNFFDNSFYEVNYNVDAYLQVHKFVGLTQLFVNLTSSLVAVICSFVKSNIEKKIFHKFDETDKLIENVLFVKVPSKRTRLTIITFSQMIFFVVRYLFRYFIVLRSKSSNIFAPFTLTVLVLKIYLIKYFFFVQLLKYRLQVFNILLKDLQSRQNKITDKQIIAIKQIHSLILDTVTMINDCFGLTLLLVFTTFFISFTNKAYVMFLSLHNYVKNEYWIGKQFNTVQLVLIK